MIPHNAWAVFSAGLSSSLTAAGCAEAAGFAECTARVAIRYL